MKQVMSNHPGKNELQEGFYEAETVANLNNWPEIKGQRVKEIQDFWNKIKQNKELQITNIKNIQIEYSYN